MSLLNLRTDFLVSSFGWGLPALVSTVHGGNGLRNGTESVSQIRGVRDACR